MRPLEHVLLCFLLCVALLEFGAVFPERLAAGDTADRVLYVSVEGNNGNSGRTPDRALRTIGAAFKHATPGATIVVGPGEYEEYLETRCDGEPNRPITLRASEPGSVVVTYPGKVLQILHSDWIVEGFIIDGQFGDKDVVKVKDGGDRLLFQHNEVRHGGRDGIDLDGPRNVRIENCYIHHMLWMKNGERKDAHGIVTHKATDLLIRGCNIHHVSGDAFQAGYGPWDRIVIDGCTMWCGPLAESMAGFSAGVNPGENAIDTKKWARQEGGRLVLRNCEFAGWNGNLIPHCSALNLKHKVEVIVDGCIVRDNHIAFRLRGPVRNKGVGGATVTVINTLIYDNDIAVRYEDGIENMRFVNNTFGSGNRVLFTRVPKRTPVGRGMVLRNNLFVGLKTPTEAAERSNLAAVGIEFVDLERHDYRLLPTANAVAAGTTTADLVPQWYEPTGCVTTDLLGRARDADAAPDCGALRAEEPAAVSAAGEPAGFRSRN